MISSMPCADGRQHLEDRHLGAGRRAATRPSRSRWRCRRRSRRARRARRAPPCRISCASSTLGPSTPGIGGISGSAPTDDDRPRPGPRPRPSPRVTSRPGVDLDAELHQRARLVVAEVEHRLLARGRARRRRACRRARARAPRSRRRGRAGARSAPPPCRPGRCRRPSRAAAAAAGSTSHSSSCPTSGLTAQRASSRPGDEVDARVAGDARPHSCGAARSDLARPVRIGDQRPSEQRSGRRRRARGRLGQVGVVEPAGGDRPARDTAALIARARWQQVAARAGTSAPIVRWSAYQLPAETLIASTPASSSQRQTCVESSSVKPPSAPSSPLIRYEIG